MLKRFVTILLFLAKIPWLYNGALSNEIREMLNNSHQLKASYYSYLQSVESQKLTHAYSYPSFYPTLTLIINNEIAQMKAHQAASLGILKNHLVTHRLLRNWK